MSAIRCVFAKLRHPTPPPKLHPWRHSSTHSLYVSPQTSKNVFSSITESNLSELISSCARECNLHLGSHLHAFVIKSPPVSVRNGLISIYSKCGELEESVKVFDGMHQRNQVSWNSMIAAFARHGNGLRALQLYEEMMKSNSVEPTDVTFLSLLQACSHVGLLHKGMEFFESTEKTYGMRPSMEHYACIVDMLGRAGLVKEATEFIEGPRVKPDALVCGALLSACSIHGNIGVGMYAAEQLAKTAPDSPMPFISLADMYSSRGRWGQRERSIKKMKDRGIAKEKGVGWIEIQKKDSQFCCCI